MSHDCNINHKVSSGSMEGAGAVEIFSRSVLTHNLICHEYLGDGDTSFKEVIDSNPYSQFDVTPVKLEFVGHIQKKIRDQATCQNK